MKLFNSVQVLRQGEVGLHFSDAVGQAIGVNEGMVLHGLALHPSKDRVLTRNLPDGRDAEQSKGSISEESMLDPSLSIVLSPFPLPSWPNLLRMSVTVSPKPGAIYQIIKALNRLGIFCRHLESTNGLNLLRFHPKHSVLHEGETSGSESVTDLVIPSTLLFIEIPTDSDRIQEYLHSLRTGGQDPAETPKWDERSQVDVDSVIVLHKRLRALIDSPNSPTDAIKSSLRVLLNDIAEGRLMKEYCVSIDWISPMSTLNRLGRLDNFREVRNRDRKGQSSEAAAWNLRARNRKKFSVQSADQSGYLIEALPWANQIWQKRKIIPDEDSFEPASWALAVCHADSDEQVICWDIFRQANAIVMAFDLLIPTSALENEWWEWIFKTVDEAGGNILTAYSSARRDGYWGKLDILAAFPFYDPATEEETDKVGKILHCFRILQGEEGRTDEFQQFRRKLEDNSSRIGLQLKGSVERELAKRRPRFKSTLRIHQIWDPKFHREVRSYRHRFAPNKFYFTKPLTDRRYLDLYSLPPNATYSKIDYESSLKTRSVLANRIIQRLSHGENIALVGAHRSGKTSVLNLVGERLAHLPSQYQEAMFGKKRALSETAASYGLARDIYPLSIRIHAGTTPPYALLPKVVQRLYLLREHVGLDEQEFKEVVSPFEEEMIGDLKRLLADATVFGFGPHAKNLASSTANVAKRFPSLNPGAKYLKALRKNEEWDKIADLTWLFSEVEEDRALVFFKRSLEMVRSIMERFSNSLEAEGEDVFLVVLVDEVAKLSGWGQMGLLQTWREAVENWRYSSIRWVISTSRPVSEFEELSPITNVFKEYNVGSLDSDECELLLDSFCARREAEETRQGVESSIETSVRPSSLGFGRWFKSPSEIGELAASIGEKENRYGSKQNLNNEAVRVSESQLHPLMTYLARHTVRRFTSRLPYFLQVFLYHLYERSTRREIPLVNRRMCCKILERDVIPEISDFLEAQWGSVSREVQDPVHALLGKVTDSAYEMARDFPEELLSAERFSPSTGKVLLRAGLKGDDDLILAPLVVLWLKGHAGTSS